MLLLSSTQMNSTRGLLIATRDDPFAVFALDDNQHAGQDSNYGALQFHCDCCYTSLATLGCQVLVSRSGK